MAIDWKAFPSLTSLRAFAAVAELLSFSAAARALNVTHAAVAQQVRALEAHLGRELVFRDGRGMALTPEGARLAAGLAEGFRAMEQALGELQASAPDAPLRITMTPAFAAQWLMPRLGAFWSAHPDVPLSLHPENRVVDLRRDGIDLGIRFGAGRWEGVEAEFLTGARYVIVGAPALLAEAKDRTPASLSALPWLIERDWPEALAWLKSYGLEPDLMNITQMPNEELALSAARQGYGLHVEAAALVEQDVKSGALVVAGAISDETLAYYIVTRPGPRRPALKTFIRWLRAAV